MTQNVTADGIRADKQACTHTHAETIPTTYRICTLNHHFSWGAGVGGVFTGLQRQGLGGGGVGIRSFTTRNEEHQSRK